MKTILGSAFILASLLGAAVFADDDDILPKNALPLSEVLATLEKGGIAPIVEANFDDGVWEIEGFRGEKGVELNVDPVSAKITAEHPERIYSKPAANGLSASAIAKSLEQAGFRPIFELDWDRSRWEAEAMNSTGRRQVHVGADGNVLSDRADD